MTMVCVFGAPANLLSLQSHFEIIDLNGEQLGRKMKKYTVYLFDAKKTEGGD